MNTVNKVIITTIIIVVLLLGGWWLIASLSSNSGNDSSNEPTNGQDTNAPDEDQEVAETITYDGTSFTPASSTIKAGEAIEIINESDNVMYFASDEHPTHLDNSELNVGDIQPGDSATFTITAPGNWGYHDHYNAAASGEITVE